VGAKQCIVVVVCVYRCGNPYLPKGITKRSEVADAEVAQPQVPPSKKLRNVLCAFLCVPSHKKIQKQKKNKARVVMMIAEGVLEG